MVQFFMHFGGTKWIEIACSTGIYIGIDKCSRPPISLGPGEISPPLPLPVGLVISIVERYKVVKHLSAMGMSDLVAGL